MNKALLFDRFRKDPVLPDQAQDPHDWQVRSIEREVSRLLNTRAPFASSSLPDRRTVIHHGLPDFLHLSPQALRDTQILANMLSDSIRAFEPRIALSEVTVHSPRDSRDGLRAHVKGWVHSANGHAMVSFPVHVTGLKQAPEAHE